ncbi:MAG TPA: UDP-galactopyranose mutase [Methylibium sp.]|uniref:UDP-galactopyranose mutase n=1 Tax=Methylibium sp. TaxID=2067992 RepID=UPI002DBD1BCB|nr:UDP-galactopyranose mutase [Methylibium sp.]HEU4460290.1 UDP-galactopyranose mutase [Methylibium sp.]
MTASLDTSSFGFDYLVVGAGFAGSVLAERLASQLDASVLVVDKRPHIGGNAYDRHDDAGLLVHPYGPHIFHTNSAEVFGYLSQFTAWRPYQHRVLASVDGQLVPLPINLDTVNRLYGLHLDATQLAEWFKSVAEPRETLVTAEDAVVSQVGRDLYNKFFRGYTRKQWALDPSQLDASVTARVPARLNRDDRYFADTYQAMPLHGYTRMFEAMLRHPKIKLMLNTDFEEVRALLPHRHLVYTGPIDAFFGYRHGRLPYRSLRFEHLTLAQEHFQPVGTVNHPNDYAYTRVTEFKHLTGQMHPQTSIVYEYPQSEGDPYYPVPQPESATLYKRYAHDAEAVGEEVSFVGRLASYRYYNMDQVVGQALATFKRLQARHAERIAPRPKAVAEAVPSALRNGRYGSAGAVVAS